MVGKVWLLEYLLDRVVTFEDDVVVLEIRM